MSYKDYEKMSYDELWAIHLKKTQEHQEKIYRIREDEKRTGVRHQISPTYTDWHLTMALEKKKKSKTKKPSFVEVIILLFEMCFDFIRSLFKR